MYTIIQVRIGIRTKGCIRSLSPYKSYNSSKSSSISPTFICAASERPSNCRPNAFTIPTFLEDHSNPPIPVTNHSENCWTVLSISFSFLMNSSSISISSKVESIVKRLRKGTPNLARRSNLRRVSYLRR